MSGKPEKLSREEPIIGLDNLTLGDFWSWAYSDILMNTTRSVFAEFLVATALGVTDNLRREWDSVDLRYQGKSFEVKSAAYLQSWKQAKPSTIKFDIAVRKAPWDAETNTYLEGGRRSADCYVFCLYTPTEALSGNILDVAAWEFYVVATELINRELATQGSVGLKRVQAICEPVQYSNLKSCIDSVLGLLS